MALYIWKASGKQEAFDTAKFTRSLQKAGADPSIIQKLINDVKRAPELQTTKDIYTYAFNYLKSINRAMATRYNIKNALYQLGPAGFPFEKFIAEIFRQQHYETQTDQIVTGSCVEHEVDIIVTDNTKSFMVECKFHNAAGIKTDVKVALYVKARFDDISTVIRANSTAKKAFLEGWLVTNTKFTTQAIKYAECAGVRLLGWAYPEKDNIADLIDQYGLYPVTALTSLNKQQKKFLIEHDIVLCRHLQRHESVLAALGLTKDHLAVILDEAAAVSNGFSRV
jgi:hypothetical protein